MLPGAQDTAARNLGCWWLTVELFSRITFCEGKCLTLGYIPALGTAHIPWLVTCKGTKHSPSKVNSCFFFFLNRVAGWGGGGGGFQCGLDPWWGSRANAAKINFLKRYKWQSETCSFRTHLVHKASVPSALWFTLSLCPVLPPLQMLPLRVFYAKLPACKSLPQSRFPEKPNLSQHFRGSVPAFLFLHIFM